MKWGFILVFISFFSLLYIAFRKWHKDNVTLHYFFNWFVFFFLYSFFMILQYYSFENWNNSSPVFYNLALLFLGLGTLGLFTASLNISVKNLTVRSFLKLLYLSGLALAIILHFIYPTEAATSYDGHLIYVYQYIWIAYFYDVFMFICGWSFGLSLLKNYDSMETKLLKAKAVFISVGAFLMPFASIFYFGAEDWGDIKLGLAFTLVGILFLGFGGFLPNLLNRFRIKGISK